MERGKILSFLVFHKRLVFTSVIIISAISILLLPNLIHLVKANFASPGDTSLIHACKDSRGRLIQIDAGGSCNANETLVTWIKDVDAGNGLSITRSSSGATLSLTSDTIDGWTPAAETWTYASASTFTVSGNQTVKYSKGTRLKFMQTTTKYAVVVGSSYSSPDTTVTILINSDYTIANAAISANYYSYAVNPQGYPGWFAVVAPTTWMNLDDGSGGAPTVTSFRQRVDGNTLSGRILIGSCYVNKIIPTADFGFLNSINAVNTSNNTAIGSGWVIKTSGSVPYPAVAFYINTGYIYIDIGTAFENNTQLDMVSWNYSIEF